MNRPGHVGFVVLLLVAAVITGIAVPVAGADFQADAQPEAESQDFDSSTFDVTVHEDGSATWTFRHERTLQNESEVADFEAFAEEFESEETDLYENFRMHAASLVATGSNQTEREMDATDFERSAGVEDGINPEIDEGVVEMTFTWHGFAPVDDDGTITVSDVFDGRLPLLADQTLTIEPGDGLRFDTVHPEESAVYTGSLESANAVSWEGEMEFPPEQPYVVVVPEDGAQGATGTAGDGVLSTLIGGDSLLSVGAILVAVVLLGALAWQRFGGVPWDFGRLPGRDGAHDGIGSAEGGTGDGGRSAGSAGSDGESGAGAGGAGANGSGAGDAGGSGPDSGQAIADAEFVSDEDRVVSLIEQNGGRMKQVNIVEETGWSKSKVSMLLSEMEEEGTISKLRVGRENIISLDGFEPEATKSPFEEN